jgi:hypothetical protein
MNKCPGLPAAVAVDSPPQAALRRYRPGPMGSLGNGGVGAAGVTQ